MHGGTPLNSAKPQRISPGQPACRHSRDENQRPDKRVESHLVRCLDGGSSPPISTKTALSHAEGRFCGDAPLLCSGALLCLGALPLLYPAAPPSVFAFGKYTAPAVALGREYVVGFLGGYGLGIFLTRDDGLCCLDFIVFGACHYGTACGFGNPLAVRLSAATLYA